MSFERPANRWATRHRRLALYAMSLLLDCLAIGGAFLLITTSRDTAPLEIGNHPLVLIMLPTFVMFGLVREVQSAEALGSASTALARALGALAAATVVVMMLSFLIKDNSLSRLSLLQFVVAAAAGLAVSKWLLRGFVNRWLGGRPMAELFLIDNVAAIPRTGMDCIDLSQRGLWPDMLRPDFIDRLSRIIEPYDRVVVACVPERRAAWALFLRASDVGGEILIERATLHGAVAIGFCDDADTLVLSRGPLSLGSRIQKRFFDLAIGAPLVVLFAPLMAIVAIVIHLESSGPTIFRQVRVGRGNRQFCMYKFRSMCAHDADGAGSRSTARNDDRVTRVGRFIRRTSIDELPQLFNVIKGDMSLVGPRPHALGSLAGDALFWEVTSSYWLRHGLKPGITGLAQVRGLRGATNQSEDLTRRLRADLEYVATWSVWRDVIILARTAGVLVHRNAY